MRHRATLLITNHVNKHNFPTEFQLCNIFSLRFPRNERTSLQCKYKTVGQQSGVLGQPSRISETFIYLAGKKSDFGSPWGVIKTQVAVTSKKVLHLVRLGRENPRPCLYFGGVLCAGVSGKPFTRPDGTVDEKGFTRGRGFNFEGGSCLTSLLNSTSFRENAFSSQIRQIALNNSKRCGL